MLRKDVRLPGHQALSSAKVQLTSQTWASYIFVFDSWASLVAQKVKNPPIMWETSVCSLVWEDTLKKGKATHPSILA